MASAIWVCCCHFYHREELSESSVVLLHLWISSMPCCFAWYNCLAPFFRSPLVPFAGKKGFYFTVPCTVISNTVAYSCCWYLGKVLLCLLEIFGVAFVPSCDLNICLVALVLFPQKTCLVQFHPHLKVWHVCHLMYSCWCVICHVIFSFWCNYIMFEVRPIQTSFLPVCLLNSKFVLTFCDCFSRLDKCFM